MYYFRNLRTLNLKLSLALRTKHVPLRSRTEEARFCEKTVNIYETALCHIPAGNILHSCVLENVVFH